MSRDWKPGDVLTDGTGRALFVVEVTANSRAAWGEGLHAVDRDGNGFGVIYIDHPRPLVVIDPEDREQVERLLNRFMQGPKGDYIGGNADDLQAALRSLIAPPKPDEPTGLGAVVEATCACHPRVASKRVHEPLTIEFEGRGRRDVPWKSRCGHHAWGELSEVKVLSEGVTP